MAQVQGGYDADFVHLPEHLGCPICFSAMREPMQTRCGHRACSSCFSALPKTGSCFLCPICRTSLGQDDIFRDAAIGREVLDLQIKCDHNKCPWKGELRDAEDHRKKCKYANATAQQSFETDFLNEDQARQKGKPNVGGQLQPRGIFLVVYHCFKFCKKF
eukprot:m.22465 g.22465  ORF g.22465 m.22465 type:complete len:160 (+) comp28344_c0_seq6:2-481(+)